MKRIDSIHEDVESLFKNFDKDNSGYLSKDEMQLVLGLFFLYY